MRKLHSRVSGFSLIEVMIAVVVLAFGLISLAALQGRLFQSGAEAKARGAATAIAQQALEDARSFAFVTPPVNADGSITYTGTTYAGLTTGNPQTVSSGGVNYTVTRTVTRYRYSSGDGKFVANTADAYNAGVPEFKQMSIDVAWAGADGTTKSIKLTESVAAVAPADAARLRKQPDDGLGGPKVYIARPSDPRILPVALGDDQDAASSNPKPNQIIQDVAAATTFSVMTYSGAGDSVLLGRKLDVAAVSCLCQAGPSAGPTNPVFEPVVWNGRQQAYLEPRVLMTSSIKTGVPDSKLANTEIKQMCTVCCRDHHETAARNPRPDPWRVLTDAERSSGSEHYGYASQNSTRFDLSRLLGFGSTGVSSYLDSCQLIRVGGVLRLGTDARQVNLLATPLKATTSTTPLTDPYDVTNFKANYGNFVRTQIASNISQVSGNGGFPHFIVPPDSSLRLQSTTTPPSPIPMSDTSPVKQLVAFGLYMDYISEDTLDIYDCVANPSRTGDSNCKGLALQSSATLEQRQLAAMARLPFYAVNVANLGEWRSGNRQALIVANANFSARTDGGLVRPHVGMDANPIPATLRMNWSNSGLASTFPVDLDDASSTSYHEDRQGFSKQVGEAVSAFTITFDVAISDGINLSNWNFEGGTNNVTCEGRFSVQCTQTYKNIQPASLDVIVYNYNTISANRTICLSERDIGRGVKAIISTGSDGTLSERTTIQVPDDVKSDALEKTIRLAVVQGTCPTGYMG